MKQNSVLALDVFDENRLVGSISKSDPIEFEYSDFWLSYPKNYEIIGIPLTTGKNNSPQVTSIFENLLPEGVLRDALSLAEKASSLFSMLLAIAGDNVGKLTILPKGDVPAEHQYKETSWKLIAEEFAGNVRIIDTSDARISISGAQRKRGIHIINEKPFLPIGTSPSTHIIKPDIKAIPSVWCSSVNEAIIMRTAKHCKLDVASVFYEPITKSCVVERFDRFQSDNGKIVRLVQYDFCQLMGITSNLKYESEGGPGIVDCVNIIKKNSAMPGVDLKRFCEWLFFNIMTGNNDSHAKNLSLYQHPSQGMRMTPFYDLMCTRLYSGLSGKFAFQVGGKDIPAEIDSKCMKKLAATVNLKESYLNNIAVSLHGKLKVALVKSINELSPSFNPPDIVIAERLVFKINKISNTFIRSIAKKSSLHVLS